VRSLVAGRGPALWMETRVSSSPLDEARQWLLLGSAILLVVSLTPPLASLASRYLVAESLQYCLLLIVVPALACVGAPWRLLGFGPLAEQLAARRAQRSKLSHAAVTLVPALGVAIAWRTAALVDRIAHDRWLVLCEAVTLVPAGLAIWVELVGSPPLLPRLPAHARIAVAAVSMWTVWGLAFLVGLSNNPTYPAYALSHRAFSISADQQFAAGLMWLIPALAFMPMFFFNLMAWLRRDNGADSLPRAGG
jgi:cytochrome c oxidase assembly factor CtaG